ncbi:TetR/AcrR family transcriptional regulator [Micromonospora sp. NPDC049559]|uniref:TetR/AcrR family transcriptional regulator n=1 Tax=Micromonospora sp. NPDC049559 TaxID=3155923 RepID=UPI00343B16AE
MGRPAKFEPAAAVGMAMDVFWRQGYGATSPQGLADELGIGKGSLYNTFDSKHNLFTQALLAYSSLRATALVELLDEPGPVRSRLRAVVEEMTGFGDHRRGCLVVNAIGELAETDAAVTEIGNALFDRIEEAFRATIAYGRSTGELTGHQPPADAASGLLATIIGTSVLVRAGGTSERVQRIVDSAIEAL